MFKKYSKTDSRNMPKNQICAKEFKEGIDSSICNIDQCQNDVMILDLGPKSIQKFK